MDMEGLWSSFGDVSIENIMLGPWWVVKCMTSALPRRHEVLCTAGPGSRGT